MMDAYTFTTKWNAFYTRYLRIGQSSINPF
jgi:hypothetical protein